MNFVISDMSIGIYTKNNTNCPPPPPRLRERRDTMRVPKLSGS